MQASISLLYTLHYHVDEVAQLTFSPDGSVLAARNDATVTLWDMTTGSLRSKIEIQNDMFFDIVFSPDNRWIAAASDDGCCRIWSIATAELEQTVSVDDERMLSLSFSMDSQSIVTGSEIMRVWDVKTGDLLHTLSGPGDHTLSFTAVYERHEYPPEISEVLVSPDGKILGSICPETHTIRLWSTETWDSKRSINGRGAKFSPDGTRLAVVIDGQATVQVYATHNWQLQSTIRYTGKDLGLMTFSSDSKVLAACSGRDIMLWNTQTSELIRTFEDPGRKITALSFSPDGKILFSGTRKCGLRAWDADSGNCLLVIEHEDGARDPWGPRGARCGPPAFETYFGDGEGKVAIAFPNGSVRVWDVKWI